MFDSPAIWVPGWWPAPATGPWKSSRFNKGYGALLKEASRSPFRHRSKESAYGQGDEMSKVVKLQASDGHELDAYVAQPDGRPWGGLVVVQEIFGVNQHIRSVADRFAQEGFYAVAPALFDRVERDVELGDDAESMQRGIALVQKINIDDAIKDVDAALQYIAKVTGKPAGVVGYCYGGTLAWLSATRLSPAAVVG